MLGGEKSNGNYLTRVFGKDLVGNSLSSGPICVVRINRFNKSPQVVQADWSTKRRNSKPKCFYTRALREIR